MFFKIERTIFQIFWWAHSCTIFLFLKLETSNFGYFLNFQFPLQSFSKIGQYWYLTFYKGPPFESKNKKNINEGPLKNVKYQWCPILLKLTRLKEIKKQASSQLCAHLKIWKIHSFYFFIEKWEKHLKFSLKKNLDSKCLLSFWNI